MDLVKKFRLVPIDRIQEHSEEHLSDLDKQIQDILKKKITDDEKAKLYAQALQKYVTFPSVNTAKPTIKEEEEEEPDENFAKIESQILDSVPVKHKKTAARILNFLKEHDVSWSPSKELLRNNISIPGSDIIQLINFLLRDRSTKPVAFEEFKEILDLKKFPQDFVKNKYLIDVKPTIKKIRRPNVKTMYALPKRRKMSPTSWLGKIHLENQ